MKKKLNILKEKFLCIDKNLKMKKLKNQISVKLSKNPNLDLKNQKLNIWIKLKWKKIKTKDLKPLKYKKFIKKMLLESPKY